MPGDPLDLCRLCLTASRSSLQQPAVMCFDTGTSVNKYTVAEVLNQHFWFEVSVYTFFVCPNPNHADS